MPIRKSIIKGTLWDLFQKIGSQGIAFLANIILARALSPDDYGLIGMIMIYVLISNIIVDSGLGNSIIKKEYIRNSDLNTVFWTNLTFSIVLYLILFFGSPMIANFYERSELKSISRILGLSILLTGFGTVQNSILIRKLEFKKTTYYSLIAAIISSICAIVLSKIGLKYWALVWQLVLNRFIYSFILVLNSKWRPTLEFKKDLFKEHMKYGGTVLGINMINQVFQNIFLVIIGKYFNAIQLGYYFQAKKINEVANRNFRSTILKVSFPAFSIIQNNNDHLTKAYNKSILYISIVFFPLVIYSFSNANLIVVSLLTVKWIESGHLLALLTLSTIFQPQYMVNNNLLLITGNKNMPLQNEIVIKTLLIISIFLIIKFGINYLLYTLIFYNTVSYIVSQYQVFIKVIPVNKFEFSRIGQVIIISSICILPIKYFFSSLPMNFTTLIISIFTFLILYLSLLLLLNKNNRKDLLQLVRIK